MLTILLALIVSLFGATTASAQLEIRGPCMEECLPRISDEVYVIAPEGPDGIHLDYDRQTRLYIPRLYTHTGEGNTVWVCDLPVGEVKKWDEEVGKATQDRHGLTIHDAALAGVVKSIKAFTYQKVGDGYHAVINLPWKKVESTMRAEGTRQERGVRLRPQGPVPIAGARIDDPLRFQCDCETWLRLTNWKPPESLPKNAKYEFYRDNDLVLGAERSPESAAPESLNATGTH